jgi:geranylgeranyl reductase family protein
MNYDVVVIGAGPAGATAAKVLSEKGISVLLLDKSMFPREKPCGGGLTVRTLKRFKYIEENNLIDSYSSRIYVHSSSLQYKVDVVKNKPITAMVLRKTFDAGLLRCATDCGAVFMGGKTVVNVRTDAPGALQVMLSDATSIPAKFVIGADGMWGSTMKQSGGLKRKDYICMSVVEEYPVSEKVIDTFFTQQRTIHVHMNLFGLAGYGWVFPKKKHLNIGLGESLYAKPANRAKINLRDAYVRYLQLLKKNKIIPETIQMKKLKGGVAPTYPVDCSTQRFLLCGDAGGFTNPLTGEGIYSGMVSGTLASNAIITALENGLTHKQTVSLYQKELQKDFRADHQRLFRLSKSLGSDAEGFIRLMQKDKDSKIISIALTIFTDLLPLKQIRWKITRGLVSLYIKDRLGMLR